MSAGTAGLSLAGSPLRWSLLFARQPEPDLEFTEEELEQTTNVRSSSPMKSPKKSGGRPIMWLLLLLLVAGGAYVAMEPEMITDLLGPLLGESPMPAQQPPVTTRPAPSVPTPGASGPAPASPPPQASAPASVPTPSPAPQPAPAAPNPSASAPAAPPAAAPSVVASPSPLFGEGQKVTAVLAPGTPGDMITLMQDPAGTKPGPTVRPGATLTILDGDLQPSGWVYSVRSDEGAKGWIGEQRLKLKP
ncbi:hypothetical protein [Nitrospira moscoviensis]|uniref:Uncharacterized protein n=1 Tax=Nitrospira moscoviensis TaxID=42253 RepID=A0A0K2GA59_NITMO|nr:hypothetical protein [Nitrospira moscoviensis]ALA57856.1 hypothetical protein NITMOv2_1429 [Nitrospira moscoviensis]